MHVRKTAVEIWQMYGGLLELSILGLRMLVDLHAMRGLTTPGKNTRWRYQIMLTDDEQSCPIQFRSLHTAQRWLRGEMGGLELQQHVDAGTVRHCGL